MLYKSSFETAAQSEMVAALFELYLALMRDVKKGIFYSAEMIVTIFNISWGGGGKTAPTHLYAVRG